MQQGGSVTVAASATTVRRELLAALAELAARVEALEGLDQLPPVGDEDDVLTVVSGEPAWAAPASGASWNVVVKPSNTSRNATTTLADDPHLKFTMAANKTYAIRIHAFYTLAGTGGNLKFGITGPSSPTLALTQRFDMPAGGAGDNAAAVESGYAWSRPVVTGAVSSAGKIRLYVIVQNGANSGTFALTWSQNTSDADNTTVYGGSTLEWVAA